MVRPRFLFFSSKSCNTILEGRKFCVWLDSIDHGTLEFSESIPGRVCSLSLNRKKRTTRKERPSKVEPFFWMSSEREEYKGCHHSNYLSQIVPMNAVECFFYGKGQG